MATIPAVPDRDFWFGAAFGRAWEVTKAAPLQILGMAFLFGALPEAVWDYIQPRVLSAPADDLGAKFLVLVPALLLGTLTTTILQGVFAMVAIGHSDGRTVRLADCVALGLRILPVSFGLMLVNLLAFSAGLLLLMIPGLIIAVIWVVSPSALTVERLGLFAALGRSRQLTKGVKGQLFAFLFFFILADLAYALAFDRIASMFGVSEAVVDGTAPPSLIYSLGGLIWNLPSDAAYATVLAALYVELRRWREGADTDKFAEIFS